MKIFFGAAIQGHQKRGERVQVYRTIMDTIKRHGIAVATEHTGEKTLPDIINKMEESIGPFPEGVERYIYVRDRMIELVESDIAAAVFEVSTPSLGTGVEIAHAYLRPRMGLSAIPVLALYQKDYWPHHLSSMIRGITPDTVPQLVLKEYSGEEELIRTVSDFLRALQLTPGD